MEEALRIFENQGDPVLKVVAAAISSWMQTE
jgi:hypothetical protein